MILFLLLLPHLSCSATSDIFRRIQASAQSRALPRSPFSIVEEGAAFREETGQVEKVNNNNNKEEEEERKGRQLIRVGEWYPASTSDRSVLDSGGWYRVPEPRSLLTEGWSPVPSHPRLDTRGKVVGVQPRQKQPGSRIGRPSLLRPSLVSSTTSSASLSIRDLFNTATGGRFSPTSRRSSPGLRSRGGRPSTSRRSSGSRVGRPSLLRSSLSSSTSSASLSMGQFHK